VVECFGGFGVAGGVGFGVGEGLGVFAVGEDDEIGEGGDEGEEIGAERTEVFVGEEVTEKEGVGSVGVVAEGGLLESGEDATGVVGEEGLGAGGLGDGAGAGKGFAGGLGVAEEVGQHLQERILRGGRHRFELPPF